MEIKHPYKPHDLQNLQPGESLIFCIGKNEFQKVHANLQAYAARFNMRITSKGFRGVPLSTNEFELCNFVLVTCVEHDARVITPFVVRKDKTGKIVAFFKPGEFHGRGYCLDKGDFEVQTDYIKKYTKSVSHAEKVAFTRTLKEKFRSLPEKSDILLSCVPLRTLYTS